MPRTRLSQQLSDILTKFPPGAETHHRFLLSNKQDFSIGNVAKQLFDEFDYPTHTVDKSEPSASDLLGEPVKPASATDNDEEVEWVDGVFTKAVRSSQTEPTILVIPDITTLFNNPKLAASTHSAIATQTNVISPDRSQYIDGNGTNLIVLAGTGEECDIKNEDDLMLRSYFVNFDLVDETLTDAPTQ